MVSQKKLLLKLQKTEEELATTIEILRTKEITMEKRDGEYIAKLMTKDKRIANLKARQDITILIYALLIFLSTILILYII